jgi:WD40 repeat protein
MSELPIFQKIQDLDCDYELKFMAFSSNGHRVASCLNDGTILLWEADRQEKFQLVQELKAQSGSPSSLTFSPDSGRIVQCFDDRRIILWEADQQGRFQLVQELETQSGSASSVAFSPDGGRIVQCLDNKRIILWEADQQGRFQLVQELGAHGRYSGWLILPTFSPDGQRIASAGLEGTLLWEVNRQGRFRLAQELENLRCQELKFSPDGRQIVASAPNDGKVRLWEVDRQGTFQPAQVLKGDKALLIQVLPIFDDFDMSLPPAFSPNGRVIAAGSIKKKVRFWEADRHGRFQKVQTLKCGRVIFRIDFSPDSRRAALHYGDGIFLLEADRHKRFRIIAELKAPGMSTFSLDGLWVFSRFGANRIEIWKAA